MGMKKDKEKKKIENEQNEPESSGIENHQGAENSMTNDPKNASRSGMEPSSQGPDAEEEAIPMVLLPSADVEKLKMEASENLENWKRERADFLNYRRIVEREEKQLRANIKIEILKKYLPILDDIERALKALPENAQEKAWFSGIDLIYRKLQKILETEGITTIPAETFNPNFHEAVTYEPSPDHQSGEIIEVIQQGYMLGDRVLRPAQVRVAK